VAIKVLEARFAREPDCAARFVEEARAVGRIRHPGIVDITDFGNLDGRPYYVMELLAGETLAARILRERALPAGEAVAIAMEVASALAAAHDHGIVHRDLKPDNVFLCAHPDTRERVKVLDFGVAKVLRRDDADAASVATRAGRLMGTPLYMSPEQCLGQPVDPRADVYALGVVLYECLTGRPPFVRETWLEVLLSHVADEPPQPSSLGRAVAPALEAIVMRALAKEPADRFADMRAMRAALAAVGEEPVAVAATSSPAPSGTAAPAATGGVRVRTTAFREAAAAGAGLADVLRDIIQARLAAGRLVLPAVPAAVAAALAELRAPNVDLAQVARTLGGDPLVAPQVLALAGAACYAAHGPPHTLLRATIALGVDRLRSVLLAMSARRVFESPRPGVRAAFDGMWAHSLAVAELVRAIGRQLGDPVDGDQLHLAGLLHDVGKPVVGAMLLEAERLIGRRFVVDRATWIEVVARSHRDVAIGLARAWNLDPPLCEALAGCDRYGGGLTAELVCLANAVAKRAGRTVGPVDHEAADALIAEGAEKFGLEWKFVHALLEQVTPPA
jgi:putative nucleotidyltransferase with HDIG domain